MSTVQVKYNGTTAVLVASPDYTGEDWDEAVTEMARRGFTPTDIDPIHRTPCGVEIHVWVGAPAAAVVDLTPTHAAVVQ